MSSSAETSSEQQQQEQNEQEQERQEKILPADAAQATEEASDEESVDPRNAAVPKLTPGGLPVSESVIEAGTPKQSGFPIDTADGRIMATGKNPDGTIETENGTMEVSDDPFIYQPAGTREAQREEARKTEEANAANAGQPTEPTTTGTAEQAAQQNPATAPNLAQKTSKSSSQQPAS